MCQTISTAYSCGCSGATFTQKCRIPTRKCESSLQHPRSLEIASRCIKHAEPRKPRQSTPPSSYQGAQHPSTQPRRNPAPFESITHRPFEIPPRRSSVNFRVFKPQSPEHRAAFSPTTATHHNRFLNNLNSTSWRFSEPINVTQCNMSIKRDRSNAIQRSLDSRRQRDLDKLAEAEKYELFLTKDRAKVEACRRERAQRKAGLKPGIREKSDGICCTM